MVTATDALLEGDLLTHTADGWQLREAVEVIAARIPDSVRALVEQQLDALAADDASCSRRRRWPATSSRRPRRRGAGWRPPGHRGALRRVAARRRLDPHRRQRSAGRRHAERPLSLRPSAAPRRPRRPRAGAPCRVRATDRRMARGAARDGAGARRHGARPSFRGGPRCRPRRPVSGPGRAHGHGAARASRSRGRADALALVERLPATAARRDPARAAGAARRGGGARGDVDAAIADFTALVRPRGTPARSTRRCRRSWRSAPPGHCASARGLALAADVVARSADAAPALQHRARGVHAYWWARQHGWRARSGRGGGGGRGDARRRPRLGARRAPRHARLLRNLRGDHAAARAAAEEALTLARDGGTALLAQWQRCWALMHLGAWKSCWRR